MAVTFTKVTETITNPFDNITETIIRVKDVIANGVKTQETYTFASGTADATIQSSVETNLTNKGYAIV